VLRNAEIPPIDAGEQLIVPERVDAVGEADESGAACGLGLSRGSLWLTGATAFSQSV
jgi:hypothetical protein